jgi:hypothetical protein
MARRRQSSGVLKRSSCCWCVFFSAVRQVALGEKHLDGRFGVYEPGP